MKDGTPHSANECAENETPLKNDCSENLLPRRRAAGLLRRWWYLSLNEKTPLSTEEYKIHIDLYKFYLDITLKAIVFFYAIAGTILTVMYGTERITVTLEGDAAPELPEHVRVLFLATPLLISLLLAVSFIAGSVLWGRLTHILNRKLELSPLLAVPPFTHVLTIVLFSFGVIFLFVFAMMLLINLWPGV
ncbi:MAG TPA: hypothetical protein VN228_11630 [Pyrinomonadaceae bacterium]|nr:hypothetical protein [Pyrinomonadaceae bacterium]